MKRKQSKTQKIAFVGLCATLALLLSYAELLLPPLFAAVPGIKIGLPNVVIIYLLYRMDVRYAAGVSFVRILIVAILFGSVMTLAYSAAGACLSLAVMGILKKTGLLSEVGVSVAGGIAHNAGQILVAAVLLDTPQIAYYMFVLTITGTIAGVFVGLCGGYLIKRLSVTKIFGF